MLLINYDLYDIYAILCVIRLYPMASENEKIVQALLDIIKAKQTDNCIMDNIVRRTLASMDLYDEHWEWIKTFNTYSYGVRIIKDIEKYNMLFNLLAELSDSIASKNKDRIYDCADALHNVPIILADGKKKIKRQILLEIESYAHKWNPLIYQSIKLVKF